MTQSRYLEMCRRLIARQFHLDAAAVETVEVSLPHRSGMMPYSQRIDLRWELETPVCRYVHIARVRWRKDELISAEEMFALQKLKERTAGHKAFYLANTGFTQEALAVAADERITAMIVRPCNKRKGSPGYHCQQVT